MLHNLILITIRSLKKRGFYTMLNLLGLAVSIGFAFLLRLYITDQRSYDRHYANVDRIYRVNADFNMNGKRDIYSNAPRPVGPTLKTDYPEVIEAARVRGLGGLNVHTSVLELNDKRIKSSRIFIADSTVFRIFEREFIQGDPDKALAEPNTIVLNESLAKRLFGDEEAFGKSLNLPGFSPKLVKVTGIVKDSDQNTHLPVEAYVSWSTYPYAAEMTQWYGAHTYTYILLDEKNDIKALHDKFPAFFEKYMKKTFDDANGKADLMFQPVAEIHLSKEYVWEPFPHGSETNVSALSVVIIFLISFACINYVNLATARATERAAEVGIRKTLGSSKRILVAQFLTESILLSLLACFVAIGLCLLLLPYFNQLTDLTLDLRTIISVKHLLYLFGLSLMIGVLSGLYPAFYLSSLNSLQTLKGKFSSSSKGEFLRKALVTSQYFIAAILIAGILFVAEQTWYIKNRDIGFNKNDIVAVRVPGDTIVSRHLDPYLEELRKSTLIKGATSSFYSLDREANQFTPTLENEDGTTFQTGADLIAVDADFVDAIGLKVVAGRNFAKGSKADEQNSILINETAVKKFGWGKNPLGGKYVGFPDANGTVTKSNVVGVVKDFNLGVSYRVINPLIIFLSPPGGSTLYIRGAENKTEEALALARSTWNNLYPGYEFEFSYLDESLNLLYNKEEKFLDLLIAFSFIIVFIASLGIVGLISYTTVLKKKEIAIRKVLGSPTGSLIYLLSKKFVVLMVIANLAALPATYYFVSLWLENFAYHIDFSAGPFLISLLICTFFTALSLIYHTMIATRANPVEALSYE